MSKYFENILTKINNVYVHIKFQGNTILVYSIVCIF